MKIIITVLSGLTLFLGFTVFSLTNIISDRQTKEIQSLTEEVGYWERESEFMTDMFKKMEKAFDDRDKEISRLKGCKQ